MVIEMDSSAHWTQTSFVLPEKLSVPHAEIPTTSDSREDATLQPFEMLEADYIQYRFEHSRQSFERERAAIQTELENISERAHKRRLELFLRLRVLTRTLEEFDNEGLSPTRATDYRHEYMRLVKDAIRRGENVPHFIFVQRIEFQRAFTGRQRYEKGRHTSFANQSIAIDMRLLDTRGIKVKLQNGKPMCVETLAEIARGLDEIEAVVGSLHNVLRATDVTLAHTSGKHPFMRGDAGGLYLPAERTVTIGTATHSGHVIRSLAHELLGHWLDYEAGKAQGVTTRVKKGRHFVDASALSEYSVRFGMQHQDSAIRQDGYLIALAASLMRDRALAEKVTRKNGADVTDVEAEDIEIYKFVLGRGDYWLAPREVFARLCEQFCAKRFHAPEIAFESFAWYARRAAYWAEDNFIVLEPLIEQALRWRLGLLGQRWKAEISHDKDAHLEQDYKDRVSGSNAWLEETTRAQV